MPSRAAIQLAVANLILKGALAPLCQLLLGDLLGLQCRPDEPFGFGLGCFAKLLAIMPLTALSLNLL